MKKLSELGKERQLLDNVDEDQEYKYDDLKKDLEEILSKISAGVRYFTACVARHSLNFC